MLQYCYTASSLGYVDLDLHRLSSKGLRGPSPRAPKLSIVWKVFKSKVMEMQVLMAWITIWINIFKMA